MIQLRCPHCDRLILEASEGATGTLRVRCKRSACGEWLTVTLPLRAKAGIKAAVRVGGGINVTHGRPI